MHPPWRIVGNLAALTLALGICRGSSLWRRFAPPQIWGNPPEEGATGILAVMVISTRHRPEVPIE